MHFPTVGKARRPKFELHLKIYELNNVPLINGSSYIKWNLAYSMYAEHRGRTNKCPISNHKVDYDYSIIIPSVRISMDKNNMLNECPFELEIVQEFALAEKITLGHVKLNLSEYVEESEPYSKDALSPPQTLARHSTTSTATAMTLSSLRQTGTQDRNAREGIIRRYLIQDSKINSTLRLGILMLQLDGDRNFVAPALRTAAVFGGIAGFTTPDQVEDETGTLPRFVKNRDNTEVQDLYRCTLAASWTKQHAQLPADECIEDIFSGGDGWNVSTASYAQRAHSRSASAASAANVVVVDFDDDNDDDDKFGNNSTLCPSDFRHIGISRHRRSSSAFSDKSVSTVTGSHDRSLNLHKPAHHTRNSSCCSSRLDEESGVMRRSRSKSIHSLAPTLGSSSGTDHDGHGEPSYTHQREVGEDELRDSFVAWTLSSQDGTVV